ncbi:MAG: hypothetical protein JSW50_16165, partial [Candidatus Latescibacterota bacterium]
MKAIPDLEKQAPSDSVGARRTGRARALWRDLITAVRGSQEDFTEGGLGRAILLLSIPMILEMT